MKKRKRKQHRNPEITPAKMETLARLVMDEGMYLHQAAAELGLGSMQVAKIAVAYMRGRRDAEATVDPNALSMTAKEKVEAAIRQISRTIEANFELRLRDEMKRAIDETVLPEYQREMADARDIINARKGIMTRETFRLIASVLHPDRSASEERHAKAFDAFNKLERVLCPEKELPTIPRTLPRTYDEMMKRRAEILRGRRAKANIRVR